MIKFDFSGLFILDMANNHKGKLEVGRRIVSEFAPVIQEAGVRCAIKFQFRQMETLAHPDFQEKGKHKYIDYFKENNLSEKEFGIVARDIKEAGMITMATPFDEESVGMIERLGIDVIKIASCSANDWPLLERIVKAGKPVVCSTGGLGIKEVDDIVSFFDLKNIDYALMHCVAIYPTPNDKLNLGRIKVFAERYPHLIIGFSTHEEPANTAVIKVARAMGASLFERHIGIKGGGLDLNAYSSTPEQIGEWLDSHKEAVKMSRADVFPDDPDEKKSLETFMRGVYAKKNIKKGDKIFLEDVFFAMPFQEGQAPSSKWQDGLVADKDYKINEMLSVSVCPAVFSKKQIINRIIRQAKAMLNMANIHLGHETEVELSHHYGIENFYEAGAVLITCIDTPNYCKKIMMLLPGQKKHPVHHHRVKIETFQVLWGELTVIVNGAEKVCLPGEILHMPRGVWHGFSTKDGVIFEEVSTPPAPGDSYYKDKNIAKTYEARKTKLMNWHYYGD